VRGRTTRGARVCLCVAVYACDCGRTCVRVCVRVRMLRHVGLYLGAFGCGYVCFLACRSVSVCASLGLDFPCFWRVGWGTLSACSPCPIGGTLFRTLWCGLLFGSWPSMWNHGFFLLVVSLYTEWCGSCVCMCPINDRTYMFVWASNCADVSFRSALGWELTSNSLLCLASSNEIAEILLLFGFGLNI